MPSPDGTTRQRLIEAAVAEIAERGWAGVRTRSVATRAGVNNALVHYHFGSVDTLRLAAAGAAFERLSATVAPEPMGGATITEAVVDAAARVGGMDPGDPVWQVLMEVFVEARRDRRLAEMASTVLEGFRAVIRNRLAAAVAAGELPASADVEGLAVAITAMLDGLGLHAWVDAGTDPRRAGAAVVEIFGGRRGEEAR